MISHGHVFPRADGTKSDCGGPRHCAMCAAEQNALNTVLENPSAVDLVLRHARASHQPSDSPSEGGPFESPGLSANDTDSAAQLERQMQKLGSFISELETLINQFSMENGSDTPDFILAQYLKDVLVAFDTATRARDKWYGRAGLMAGIKEAIETVKKPKE